MDTLPDYTLTFGLRVTDLIYMKKLFEQHTDIDQVWLYGSRAKGSHRPGSDVDLALVGPQVKRETVRDVLAVLADESPMPFFFDVLHWDSLSNQSLKAEIQRTAQPLYQRTS